MHNPYDVNTWSKLYREDALREAQARHLVARAHGERASGGVGLFRRVSRGSLAALLRRRVPAEERPL